MKATSPFETWGILKDASVAFLTLLAACGSPSDRVPDTRRLEITADNLGKAPSETLPNAIDLHDLAQVEIDRQKAIEEARERLERMAREVEELPTDAEAQQAWLQSYVPKDPEKASPVDSFLYGCALDLAGERSRARFELERAARDRDFQPAILALGRWHYRAEEYSAAQPYLAQALRLDPHDIDARFLLADVYERTQRVAEAEAIGREGLKAVGEKHAEERRNAGFWLSSFLARQGRHDEIVSVLNPLTAEFPKDPELHLRLARTYLAIGQAQEAVKHFDLLLELRAGWEQLLEYAQALRMSGDPHKAAAICAEILEKAPDSFFARVPRPIVRRVLTEAQDEIASGGRVHYDPSELVAIARNTNVPIEERVEASVRLVSIADRLPPRLVQELVNLNFSSGDPDLKVNAIRLLARRLPDEGILILKAVAEGNDDEKVRVAACVHLSDVTSASAKRVAAETLLQCLEGPSTDVFHAAQASLERLTGAYATTWSREELDTAPDERRRVIERWKANVDRFRGQLEREGD